MKTTTVKIKDIKPAEYNPRETLQPGETEYEALKNSVERFGMAAPLIINERTGRLVSGHQRLNILMDMGVEETEAVIVDMDDQREKGLNVALNKIDGFWDYEKLESLLNEMAEEDLVFTGFSTDELENLLDEKLSGENEVTGEMIEMAGTGSAAPKKGEFCIYLSFPGREQAEKWMEERGIEQVYRGASRSVSVRMEGSEYGSQGD